MKNTITIFVIFLAIYLASGNPVNKDKKESAMEKNDQRPERTKRQSVGSACKWMGDQTGWACDDRLSRATWRGLTRVRNGNSPWSSRINDCNSFCRINHGASSGSCINNRNYDRSTWCPVGHTCKCNH